MASPKAHVLPLAKTNSSKKWIAGSKNLLLSAFRRYSTTRLFITCVLATLLSAGLLLQHRGIQSEAVELPPLFEEWHAYERSIIPSAAASTKPYIYFENRATHSGWGNVMQELLLNVHLAHAAGWGYVFDNYTWSLDMDSEYAEWNGRTVPARIPLSALLMGHAIGGDSDSISVEVFRKICPEPMVVRTEPIRDRLGERDAVDGVVILEAWVEELRRLEGEGIMCVTLPQGTVSVFENSFFGSRHVLSLFPHLQGSPAVQRLAWSPLALSAFVTNERFFQPAWMYWRTQLSPHALSYFSSFLPSSSAPYPVASNLTHIPSLWQSPYAPIPGLLVLHIRRGDFEDHCRWLAGNGATFLAFNNLPQLSADAYVPGDAAAAMRRCFPSIPQIVARISEELQLTSSISRVYVMSNGLPTWLAELSFALKAVIPGAEVHTSRDLVFERREEKSVAHITDFYVAQRADVFVGNGFSSLTSNIVLMRLANGGLAGKTRLL